MFRILLFILFTLFFSSEVYAQRVTSPPQRIRFGTTLPSTCTNGMLFQDTDATAGQQIYACESGAWVLQGDGGGGGGGDNITVNTTAATNANFLDNLYIDWAIDTAATPDDITSKFNYAETLAGNPALLVDECVLMKDASGGGFICEGSTADTNEQLYRFPDVNGSDTTTYFALTSQVDGTIALGTDTSGNYAAGDAEAGAALTGDSATDFFSSGTLGVAIGGTGTTTSTGTGAVVLDTSPVFTTSIAIPQGTSPTVDAAGEIAVDTTDDQLIYYGGAKRVIPYERTVCFVIENLAAADDNFAFYMANDAITVTSVGCNCRGTCTTAATFTLEDRGGNAMTITGTNPTCATTGAATFAAVTAGGGLTAGEMAAFDVTNAVSPETDEYSLCITYTVDAQ